MKSAFHRKTAARRGVTVLIALLIYAVSLTAGMFVIIGYSMFWRQENQSLPRIGKQAEDVLAGTPQLALDQRSPNMSLVIYAEDGSRFLTVEPSNAREGVDISQPTERYIERVLGGASLYRPAFLLSADSPIPLILTVYGTPVIKRDAVIGAVFIVNANPELAGASLGFLCFYTLFYWITAGCVMATFNRIRRTDRTRQIYIANITHSLKAPIASVKAVTETLSDVQTLDEDRKMAYYGTILREMNTLNHLVSQVLELSRLQSGECRFVKRATSFEEAFGPAIEKFKILCACTQITFDVSEDLDHLPLLNTDAEAAGTVLAILLENAVKYTHPGDTIRISSAASKRRITFCVWDNGGAIPEQDIPYIFDRFYKGKNSGFSSSGLGLAIARETIVNLHEKIWVKCIQPRETMFFFTITTA